MAIERRPTRQTDQPVAVHPSALPAEVFEPLDDGPAWPVLAGAGRQARQVGPQLPWFLKDPGAKKQLHGKGPAAQTELHRQAMLYAESEALRQGFTRADPGQDDEPAAGWEERFPFGLTEVAEELGVSKRTVQRMIKDLRIPEVPYWARTRFGRTARFSAAYIETARNLAEFNEA
jgi:excisionase family DNA binding protein